MNLRPWLFVLSLLTLSVCPLFGAPRNLVVVVADDLGTTLGAYGDVTARTPHLDRLASEGVRFTNAFCTTASCSPSRSVILTGLHNHATGQYGLAHATHHFVSFQNLQPLPVLLREAGYRTARIGKFHVQPEALYAFDETLTGMQGGDRNGVAMAEKARPFLARRDDKPFFLYFCSSDPHRSGNVNQAVPARPDRFGNGREYAGVSASTFAPEDIVVPPYLPDTPACRAELAEYYEAAARFDQGVGRLLQIIDETGHRDDTVVLVLSDNGPPFPGAKTTLYEPGMRLPFIVRAPGLKKPGSVNEAMVSWVDITPTLLEIAGARGPRYPLHGRSFLSVLEAEKPAGWDEVFASHSFHEVTMYYPMRVVRTRTHKLVWNIAHPLSFPFASDLHESATWQDVLREKRERYGQRLVRDYLQRPRIELYDLQKDAGETTNLASNPELAGIRAELEARLRSFQERTKDPWLVKYEHE